MMPDVYITSDSCPGEIFGLAFVLLVSSSALNLQYNSCKKRACPLKHDALIVAPNAAPRVFTLFLSPPKSPSHVTTQVIGMTQQCPCSERLSLTLLLMRLHLLTQILLFRNRCSEHTAASCISCLGYYSILHSHSSCLLQ